MLQLISGSFRRRCRYRLLEVLGSHPIGSGAAGSLASWPALPLVLRTAARSHQPSNIAPTSAVQIHDGTKASSCRPRFSIAAPKPAGKSSGTDAMPLVKIMSHHTSTVIAPINSNVEWNRSLRRVTSLPERRRSPRGCGPDAGWCRSIRARIPGACPSHWLNMVPIGRPRPATAHRARSGS